LAQVTVEPGGTTIVLFCRGGFSWRLRHPASDNGISTASMIRRMRFSFASFRTADRWYSHGAGK